MGELKIVAGVELKNYSTFKIGGPARFFTTVTSIKEMQEAIFFAKEQHIPFHILGKGSNSLFDDRGFNGLVIYNKIDHCLINKTKVVVGAGYSFSLLGTKTAKLKLSGLEFASGIPGSVGGAIYMNAGANGQETSNLLESVLFIDHSGAVKSFKKEELHFSYRSSPFRTLGGAILEATFDLVSDLHAQEKQKELIEKRIKTQPYSQPSCGCVFKNLTEVSAGKLIDECGLKGVTIGGASVSTLHANFIVNTNDAKAEEVIQLIGYIQAEVKKQKGLHLHPEILYIPYQQ